ncbi:hypothetical protein JHK85_028380 [Glycine max]|nr:hypothetical protein JHK85_028380 [Glycine max]
MWGLEVWIWSPLKVRTRSPLKAGACSPLKFRTCCLLKARECIPMMARTCSPLKFPPLMVQIICHHHDICISVSHMGSQYSPLIEVDFQALAARLSTKGSNVETADVDPLGDKNESHTSPKKLPEIDERGTNDFEDDPLRQLIKSLYYMYDTPVELKWDGRKFGLPNVDV